MSKALHGAPASIVDVSDRNIGIEVTGARAGEAINAFNGLDLDGDAFPVGMCTRTLFGKAEIVALADAGRRLADRGLALLRALRARLPRGSLPRILDMIAGILSRTGMQDGFAVAARRSPTVSAKATFPPWGEVGSSRTKSGSRRVRGPRPIR